MKKFSSGEFSMEEAKKHNPDCGSIVYEKDGERLRVFVDGSVVTLSDMEREKERLTKRNALFQQIEDLRTRKESLSKTEMDRLFILIDGLEEYTVKLLHENK